MAGPGMTAADYTELDALAKDVSTGTNGRFPVEAYPFLAEVARTCAALAWQADVQCRMCPRPMSKHTCSCPHAQARKRLMRFGVWPEGAA
jgi:hypothetical protein